MRLQFALHGHAVAMSREEYDEIKDSWTTPSKDYVIIQLAVVGPEKCIAFVDKNKLIQITCVPLYSKISSSSPGTWYDSTLVPCPILDIEGFKANLDLPQNLESLTHSRKTNAIYFEIVGSNSNKLWNGIGTSHAVEILHMARIHPEEKTNTVFRSEDLRTQLVQAIHNFFAQVYKALLARPY